MSCQWTNILKNIKNLKKNLHIWAATNPDLL